VYAVANIIIVVDEIATLYYVAALGGVAGNYVAGKYMAELSHNRRRRRSLAACLHKNKVRPVVTLDSIC
jgi:hypothetical protein